MRYGVGHIIYIYYTRMSTCIAFQLGHYLKMKWMNTDVWILIDAIVTSLSKNSKKKTYNFKLIWGADRPYYYFYRLFAILST